MTATHTTTPGIVLEDYREVDAARLCRAAVDGASNWLMDLPESLTAQQREEVIGVIHNAISNALMEFFNADRGDLREGTYQLLSDAVDEALWNSAQSHQQQQAPQP